MSDTTPREQLAQIIAESPVNALGDTLYDAYFNVAPDMEKLATAILAAGFRPPARVVTTVEELDALVAHTVVRYCTRYGWGTAEKVACDRWWPAGVVVYLTNTHVLHHGPATVLYEPKEGE